MAYLLNLTVEDNTYYYSIIMAIIFALAFIIITFVGNYFQVKNNWSRMRCRPEVMMFSWLYGIDANNNMEYCLENAGKQMKQGNIVDPVITEMVDTKNVLNNKMSEADKQLNALKNKVIEAKTYNKNRNNNLAIALQNNILAIKEGMQKIIASLIIQRHMNNGVFKMTSGTKTLTDSIREAMKKV
jgi:hypothetical protein